MQIKRISPQYLPERPPLLSTIVFWLLLERLGAASWAWGVYATIFIFFWSAWIVYAACVKVVHPKDL